VGGKLDTQVQQKNLKERAHLKAHASDGGYH
jgi:hypothetical protein